MKYSNVFATETSKFSDKEESLSWVRGSIVMLVKLAVQLGKFALAVTVTSLTMLGPISSSSSQRWFYWLETSLDPTEETSICDESGSESGNADSLSPTSLLL